MKKTVRKVGMGLFAILMCVNFTSCSPDDGGDSPDSPTNQPGNEKKLTKVISYDVEDSREELNEILEFIYDTNGNVVEILEKDADGDIYSCKYVWDSNKSVTYQWDDDSEEFVKYMLTDGRITMLHSHQYSVGSMSDYYMYFIYDQNGYVKEVSDDEVEKKPYRTYTWNNGKLSFYEDYNELVTLRYGDKTCKGFFPVVCEEYACDLDDYLFIAQPELLGIKTTYLPSKIIDGNCTISFEYELDAEGYVGSCAVNEYYSYDHDYNGDGRDDYHSYDYLYEFIWE